MTNHVRTLELMLEEIDRHGWCQHAYREADGSVCLLGAYGQVMHLAPESITCPPYPLLEEIGLELGYGRAVDPTELIRWNDAPDRSVEDVKLVIKRAIERASVSL